MSEAQSGTRDTVVPAASQRWDRACRYHGRIDLCECSIRPGGESNLRVYVPAFTRLPARLVAMAGEDDSACLPEIGRCLAGTRYRRWWPPTQQSCRYKQNLWVLG